MLSNYLKNNSLTAITVSLPTEALFILFIILLLSNFNGCGVYSFTGASVPEHIKTIAIPIADDRSGSGEPGLRESLTDQLIKNFIDDNTLRVTDIDNANALLECTITGFSDAPSIVSAGEQVTSRRITISVLVTYRDVVKKKNIFEKTFSNYGDYKPTGSVEDRRAAIQVAVDHISEDILLDTVSGW
ncbi:MAG TPA: LptE family protein [Ignavibacteriaceae bacterium]|nr:LptE family protein [Ignavibacteriaceae bacterium]